jgi:hypothetical protein
MQDMQDMQGFFGKGLYARKHNNMLSCGAKRLTTKPQLNMLLCFSEMNKNAEKYCYSAYSLQNQ